MAEMIDLSTEATVIVKEAEKQDAMASRMSQGREAAIKRADHFRQRFSEIQRRDALRFRKLVLLGVIVVFEGVSIEAAQGLGEALDKIQFCMQCGKRLEYGLSGLCSSCY